jgi:hypothetical protein
MPLLDHFHPPLIGTRHWESFHALWAGVLVEWLNLNLLPEGYFAEVQVHVGGRVEMDLGTFERDPSTSRERYREQSRGASTVATLTAPIEVWVPPEPDLRFPAIFPDIIEILVFDNDSGPNLVGAVEFVSPGNKDRPEARRAFAAKCASYLQEGIGLAVVDIVTNRNANLHNELIDLLEVGELFKMADNPGVYATSYRPSRRSTDETIDTWVNRLALGEPLPILPLALRGGPCLPLELEATYAEVCRRSRLTGARGTSL